MKLLHVVNLFEESTYGGPQRRALLVASSSDQFKTTFLINKYKSSQFYNQLCLHQQPCVRLPMTHASKKSVLHIIVYILAFPYDVLSIALSIRRIRPDIVHVSGGSLCIKSLIGAFLSFKPIAWHVNDTKTITLIRLFFPLLTRLATTLLAASNASIRYYGLKNSPKTILVPAPTLTLDANNLTSLQEKRLATLNVQSNIVSTYHINPLKGFDIYCFLYDFLLNRQSSYQLRHIGLLSPHQIRYQRSVLNDYPLHSSHIASSLLGFQSDISSIYSDCHYYLCTSYNESSPLAVWEAMAMGLPIMTTDVGDAGAIVRKYNAGIVFSSFNKLDIAKELIKFLDTVSARPELWRCYSTNAFTAAITEFSLAKICNLTYSAYHRTFSK